MYRQRPPRSPVQRFALAAAAVLAVALGYFLGNRFGVPGIPRTPQALVAASDLPDVSGLVLTDHYGQPFGAEQLDGRWSLLAFVHPADAEQTRAAVTRLVLVHNRLVDQPTLQKTFRGLALALDPLADPRQLRDIVSLDSPDFLGLSGDAEGVGRLVPDHSLGNPAASLALVDPTHRLRGWFTGEAPPATIAGDIKALARAHAAQ